MELGGKEQGLSEKELLEQQLADKKQELEAMEARAGEFYDVELFEEYKNTVLGIAAEMRKLYFETKTGKLYAEGEKSQQAYQLFQQQQLKPIRDSMLEIQFKISSLKDVERKAAKEAAQKIAEEQFTNAKNELEEKLFNALEAIHAQLPPVAREVGMSTEAAMNMYLPRLVYKAEEIGFFMNQLEDATNPSRLSMLQERIDASKVLE